MGTFASFLYALAWVGSIGLLLYGGWMLFLGGSIVKDRKERGLVDISLWKAYRYTLSSKMNWRGNALRVEEAIGMLRKGEFSLLGVIVIILVFVLF